MAPTTDLHVLAISGVTISDGSLAKLRQVFPVVHYHPDHKVPRELWKDVEVWYTRYTGFPEGITLGDIPKTRALQLSSGESLSRRARLPGVVSRGWGIWQDPRLMPAGANVALQHPVFQSEEGKKQIKVCSASGEPSLSFKDPAGASS